MKDIFEEAKNVAKKIEKSANEKYPKEWPFLNDKEFEEITKGIIEVSQDNFKCILSCHGGCCPDSCSFEQKNVGACGIYEFRPASCRIFFCDGVKYGEYNKWTIYQALPSKLENGFYSAITGDLKKRANCVKNSFINNEISSKEAKQKWREIIQEYRNRKI